MHKKYGVKKIVRAKINQVEIFEFNHLAHLLRVYLKIGENIELGELQKNMQAIGHDK